MTRVDSSFATESKNIPSRNEAYDCDSDAYGDYSNDNSLSFVGPAEEPVINNFFWLYRSFPHLYWVVDWIICSLSNVIAQFCCGMIQILAFLLFFLSLFLCLSVSLEEYTPTQFSWKQNKTVNFSFWVFIRGREHSYLCSYCCRHQQ